jgi:hypothetical protein
MTTQRIHQDILNKVPTYIQVAIRFALPFLSKQKSDAWLAIWSLQRQFLLIFFENKDPSVKTQTALWWMNELKNLKENKARHPLTLAVQENRLLSSYRESHLDQCYLDWIELLSTNSTSWINQAELSRFANKLIGNTELLMAEVLLGTPLQHQMSEFVLAASEARFRIELLRDFGYLIRQEILPIPTSDLNSYNLLSQDVLRWRHENQAIGWLELADLQANYAKDKAQKGKVWLEHLPLKEQKSQWLTTALLNIELSALEEIKADQYAVISQNINIPPRKSVWLIIKAKFFS